MSLSLTLSLSLYIHSSPRREREEKLNSQTPTRCRRNAKPWRAAEPRSPPRTPEPALGPARSKVGRRRPAGGRAAGSWEPTAGTCQPGWPPAAHPRWGDLGAQARLLPPPGAEPQGCSHRSDAQLVRGEGLRVGKGRGDGRRCGRLAEGNGRSAKQSRLPSPLQFVTGMGIATLPH